MRVAIVSLFPELLDAVARFGVLGRALERGIVELDVVNPRAFAEDRHRTVDDRPYGGGPGMVMMVEPLAAAIASARARAGDGLEPQPELPVVYLSPRGRPLDQALVGELAGLDGMILVAGRYEGVDERFMSLVDLEVSIGDYVLSGGELPALVVLDAVARQLPGTLGNAASAVAESHLDGLLDYPHYTRPENAASGPHGHLAVPAVLVSGDHRAITRWRLQQALLQTYDARPDLLAHRPLSERERELLAAGLREREEAREKGRTRDETDG